jgi:hypothetical protein
LTLTKKDLLMNSECSQFFIYRQAALILLAVPLGCGKLEPTDPDMARETLTLALDAWRDGRTVDEVTNGNPPITVADPAWKAGLKLSSYQIADATKTAGFDLKIPVELSLLDQKGKATREKVKYTVSVQPARTVIHAPF